MIVIVVASASVSLSRVTLTAIWLLGRSPTATPWQTRHGTYWPVATAVSADYHTGLWGRAGRARIKASEAPNIAFYAQHINNLSRIRNKAISYIQIGMGYALD